MGQAVQRNAGTTHHVQCRRHGRPSARRFSVGHAGAAYEIECRRYGTGIEGGVSYTAQALSEADMFRLRLREGFDFVKRCSERNAHGQDL